jgi:hypothetical protein
MQRGSRARRSALREAGLHVSGHIGAADPAVALSDGLRTYRAELVIIVRQRTGGRYLEDVPLKPAAEIFSVPAREVAAEDLAAAGRESARSSPIAPRVQR